MTTEKIKDDTWSKIDVFRGNSDNESYFIETVGKYLLKNTIINKLVTDIIASFDYDKRWSTAIAMTLLREPDNYLTEQYGITKENIETLNNAFNTITPLLIIHLTQ